MCTLTALVLDFKKSSFPNNQFRCVLDLFEAGNLFSLSIQRNETWKTRHTYIAIVVLTSWHIGMFMLYRNPIIKGLIFLYLFDKLYKSIFSSF